MDIIVRIKRYKVGRRIVQGGRVYVHIPILLESGVSKTRNLSRKKLLTIAVLYFTEPNNFPTGITKIPDGTS